MSTAIRDRARGVTLLELLVVLMILSIVLTAAVRTWDVTLERGRAETTARKLSQLVKAIIGDPDYIVAGHRADFGFVGDMGRLPVNLRELVVAPSGSAIWRGPYIRSTFNQSADGFQMDGWGDTIVYGYQVYGQDSLFVRSYGGRGYADKTRWQTLYLPYDYNALTQNLVQGHVVDVRGNQLPSYPLPPGNGTRAVKVTLYYPRNGVIDTVIPGSVFPDFRFLAVPQGNYRIEAFYVNFNRQPAESLKATQDIAVYPGPGARDIKLRLPLDWNVWLP